MTDISTLQTELSQLIISVSNLSHVKPEEINPDQSLMRDGLGLDSIDILELVVNLEKKYGFKLRNDESGREALSSLRNLATYTKRQLEGATSQ
ncbi:MAG: phosphopantetheine-binding protein [Pseudomonadota bacterium]